MTTLADMPTDIPDPVHLLLIADTKLGKSTYVAQAAKDGFHVIYIDSDNGLSALRHHLQGDIEAQRRVTYVRTDSPAQFLEGFFEEPKLFRWDLTRDSAYTAMLVKPDTEILEIDIQKLLNSRGIILSIDTWTSVAADAMGFSAEKAKVKLTDMGSEGQGVYGNAYRRVNLLAACLQHAPFHVIVQAHGSIFERFEKPTGKSTREMKQNELTLVEVIEVPLSTSKPHGKEMGKFFNHIAWLKFDHKSFPPATYIDFTRSSSRIGGGPPNVYAKADDFGFIKYAMPGPLVEGTIVTRKGTELSQPALASAGHKGALRPAAPNGTTESPAVATAEPATKVPNPLAGLAIFKPQPNVKE